MTNCPRTPIHVAQSRSRQPSAYKDTSTLNSNWVRVPVALLFFVLAASILKPAFAAFSEFVVITPANDSEHGFLIQAKTATGRTNQKRVRVIGPMNGDKVVWLVLCKKAVQSDEQNFRTVIWGEEKARKDITRVIRLNRGRIMVPESGGHEQAYVEVTLSDEHMARGYIYIDYPRPVDDGGYYYSVDLAYYLAGPLGKKSEIHWEQ